MLLPLAFFTLCNRPPQLVPSAIGAPLLRAATQVGADRLAVGWLSDDVLLVRRRSGKQWREFERCEVTTGKMVPLVRLNAQIDRLHPSPFEVKLSPNRRWLLWDEEKEDQYSAVIAAVDGSRTYRIPIGSHPATCGPFRNDILWGTEDNTWLEVERRPKQADESNSPDTLLVRKIGSGRVVRRVRVPADLKVGEDEIFVPYLVPAGGRLIDLSGCSRGVRIVTVAAGTEVRVTGEQSFGVATHGEPVNENISADGTKLCWMSQQGQGAAKKLLIYTADLQSGKVRTLGYIPYQLSKVSGDPEEFVPAFLRGLSPSGNRLCIEYHNELYTVVVD
jgi:hypothetical protein